MNLSLSLTNNIRLTRGASAFTPASLSPTAWYDPSDLSTLWQDTAGTSAVTADGQSVARIDDKSGNGRHLVQATAGSRPLYKTSGGLHWLLFDGTDDVLNVTASGIGCGTVVVGVNVGGAAAAGVVTDTVDDSTGVDIAFTRNSSNWEITQAVGGSLSDSTHIWRDQSQTVVIDFGNPHVYSADGTNYPGTMEFGSGLMVGQDRSIAGRFLGGPLYGLLCFADILSEADRNLVEEWLAAKSGVTL